MKPALDRNDLQFELIHSDEFEGDGPIDSDKWRFEPMDRGWHRAGNKGMTDDGTPMDDRSAKARWAARYNRYHDELAFRRDGFLVMKGKAVETPNPLRKNFTLDGVEHRYGDFELFTAWIDTASPIKVDGKYTTDSEPPGLTWGPGHAYEIRFCVQNMCAPGHRLSCWNMPYEYQGELVMGDAYDEDVKNGVELDWFEYDPAEPNLLQCKVIGGDDRQTSGGSVDCRQFGIDITVGFHTITILRFADLIQWWLDGKLILEDTEHVPQSEDYIALTREMNAGRVKAEDKGWREGYYCAEPPHIPHDPGLYCVSVIESVDKLDEDEALIDYIRVFKMTEIGEQFTRSIVQPQRPSKIPTLERIGENTLHWKRAPNVWKTNIFKDGEWYSTIDEWSGHADETEATVPDLPPGDYQVEALGSEMDFWGKSNTVRIGQ